MHMYCPVVREMVAIEEACCRCLFWDDGVCLAGPRKTSGQGPGLPSHRKRMAADRRLARRGGGGLRLPTVWEKWPGGTGEDVHAPTRQDDQQTSDGGDETHSFQSVEPTPWEYDPAPDVGPAVDERTGDATAGEMEMHEDTALPDAPSSMPGLPPGIGEPADGLGPGKAVPPGGPEPGFPGDGNAPGLP